MPAEDDGPSREGEHLAEKYLLGKRLGSGGMGEVYRAQNTLIGRSVAIKVLRREHAENKEVVARFLREARAANIVRHPNVVDVLDIGQDATGTPFIVQELLEGEDLSEYVEAAGGRLPIDDVIRLLTPVVEAVALGHAKGVIHRDLKPDNVFLARQGGKVVPKLLDFGISQIALAAGELRLTAATFSMGTPAYMSPEHIRGTHLDAGTDVWAIGIMLHELVAGRLPFRGETQASLFVLVCTEDPIPLREAAPHAPAAFARIVARCLRRERAERYANAGELANDLLMMGDPHAGMRIPSIVPLRPGLGARSPLGTAPTLIVAQKPAAIDVALPRPIAPPVAEAPPSARDSVLDPHLKSGLSLHPPDAPVPIPKPSRPRPLIGVRESEQANPPVDPRISGGVVLFVALTVGAVAAGWVYDALDLADQIVSLRATASAAPLVLGVVLLAGAGLGITRAAPAITDDMRIKHYSRLPGELAFAMALGAAIYVAARCIV
jgi:serine/threonine protein kinase